jgi:hypothetical protein
MRGWFGEPKASAVMSASQRGWRSVRQLVIKPRTRLPLVRPATPISSPTRLITHQTGRAKGASPL